MTQRAVALAVFAKCATACLWLAYFAELGPVSDHRILVLICCLASVATAVAVLPLRRRSLSIIARLFLGAFGPTMLIVLGIAQAGLLRSAEGGVFRIGNLVFLALVANALFLPSWLALLLPLPRRLIAAR